MAMIAKKKYVSLKKSDSESSKLKPLTPESSKLKPLLKRISPAEALAKKGLKTLKTGPKELKPLVSKKKELKSLKPATDLGNAGNLYIPTHFRKKEPKLPDFKGRLEKFNYSYVRNRLKGELELAALNMHTFPKAGNEKGLKSIQFLTDDCFQFYMNLTDPGKFEYDLLEIAEKNSKVQFNLFNAEKLRKIKNYSLETSESMRPLIYNTGSSEYDSFGLKKEKLQFEEQLTYGPLWYQGFTGDTWINYWAESDGRDGFLEFYDDVASVKIPINYRASDGYDTNSLFVAKRGITDDSNDVDGQWKEKVVVHHPAAEYFGRLFVYFDLFDHVRFHVNSGSVKLKNVNIKLNGEYVCQTQRVKEDGRLDYFQSDITPDQPKDISTAIYLSKHRHVGYSSNDILKTASQQYGRSWCIKWGCDWERDWCSEFVAWVLKNATNLPLIPEGNIDYKQLIGFFRGLNYESGGQLINREQVKEKRGGIGIKYKYGDLDLVGPGFYTSINNGNHSCIFVKWGRFIDDHTAFNPASKKNRYIRIGGNQDYRVNLGHTWVYNDFFPRPKPPEGKEGEIPSGIFWQGVEHNVKKPVDIDLGPGDDDYVTWWFTVRDGFGDPYYIKPAVGLSKIKHATFMRIKGKSED